jgi:hypothetical protein
LKKASPARLYVTRESPENFSLAIPTNGTQSTELERARERHRYWLQQHAEAVDAFSFACKEWSKNKTDRTKIDLLQKSKAHVDECRGQANHALKELLDKNERVQRKLQFERAKT